MRKRRSNFRPVPGETYLLYYIDANAHIARAVTFFREGEWLASSAGTAIKQRNSK